MSKTESKNISVRFDGKKCIPPPADISEAQWLCHVNSDEPIMPA